MPLSSEALGSPVPLLPAVPVAVDVVGVLLIAAGGLLLASAATSAEASRPSAAMPCASMSAALAPPAPEPSTALLSVAPASGWLVLLSVD